MTNQDIYIGIEKSGDSYRTITNSPGTNIPDMFTETNNFEKEFHRLVGECYNIITSRFPACTLAIIGDVPLCDNLRVISTSNGDRYTPETSICVRLHVKDETQLYTLLLDCSKSSHLLRNTISGVFINDILSMSKAELKSPARLALHDAAADYANEVGTNVDHIEYYCNKNPFAKIGPFKNNELIDMFIEYFLNATSQSHDVYDQSLRRALIDYKSRKKQDSSDAEKIIADITGRTPERSNRIAILNANVKHYRKAGLYDISLALAAEVNRLNEEIVAEEEAVKIKEADIEHRRNNIAEATRVRRMMNEEKEESFRIQHDIESLNRRRKTIVAYIDKLNSELQSIDEKSKAQNQFQFNVHAAAKKRRQQIASRQAEKKKKSSGGGDDNVKSCSQLLK